jgi:hypothetical protein
VESRGASDKLSTLDRHITSGSGNGGGVGGCDGTVVMMAMVVVELILDDSNKDGYSIGKVDAQPFNLFPLCRLGIFNHR